MDEDVLNLEIRSLLEEFGVTAQRALEMTIHEAVESGALSGDGSVTVVATLEVAELDLDHERFERAGVTAAACSSPNRHSHGPLWGARHPSTGLSRSAASPEP